MRKLFSPLAPLFMLLLACAAAHAQPAQERSPRCRAAALRYLGPSPDKKHLTVEEENEYEYRGAKKYLSVCGDADDNVTRSVKESVALYEAARTLERLLPAVRRPGSPESKDPDVYAAIAAAYEVQLVSLMRHRGAMDTLDAMKGMAEAIDTLLDLEIDAYARAVAACGAAAGCQERKAFWMGKLTGLYKRRHGGSDKGLDELIKGVPGRPMPGGTTDKQ